MPSESYHTRGGAPGNSPAGLDTTVGEHDALRPYLGVYFRCANRYVKTFRSVDGSEYVARCPVCAKPVRFRVGPGGTAQRFFEVSCR